MTAPVTTPDKTGPERKSPERLLLRLEWRVLRRLEGRLAGGYRTVQRGGGTDLAGLSAYTEGDDARHIDWNVTARMNEPMLRVFNEERELTVWLVLDRSASMTVGQPGRGKHDVLSELAVLLARLFSRGGNKVGALISVVAVEQLVGLARDRDVNRAAAAGRCDTGEFPSSEDLRT